VTEPVKVTVTRWLCPHCRRGRAHKQATVEHIARCWANPERHTCRTCAHQQRDCVWVPYCELDEDRDIVTEPRSDCPLWAAIQDTGGAA
jgi:hypothetical protein